MADNFRNSESVCRSDASHQVLAKSDLWFGRNCRLQNSRWRLSWISKATLNRCVTVMLPIKFWLNPIHGLGGDVF